MSLDFNGSFEEFKRRLEQRDKWLGAPLRRFHQKADIKLQGLARENAPVDRGQLKQSIAYRISTDPIPLTSEVGTNKSYATSMEYGTNKLSERPELTGSVPFPTGAQLETWARRHGFPNGYVVANAIRKRGGIAPRQYLRNAFEQGARYVKSYLKDAGREMERLWNSL